MVQVNSFWNDALKYGAIVGLVMGLSRIYETWAMFTGEDVGIGFVFVAEWILSVVAYVWMLFRFSRLRASHCDPKEGFTFGRAWSFSMMLIILAAIIVGVMYHIYITIVGYDSFVAGYMSLMDKYEAMIQGMGMPSTYGRLFDDMREAMRNSTAPTMFDNIVSSVYNYLTLGAVLSLAVAATVRREPKYTPNEDDSYGA